MDVDDASAGQERPPGGAGISPAPLTGSLFLGSLADVPPPRTTRLTPKGSSRRDRAAADRLWWRRMLVGVVVLALMGGSIYVSRTGPRKILRDLGLRKPPCAAFTHVDVVASPDISSALTQALLPAQKAPLGDGDTCLVVSVTAQEPAQTLAGPGVLPRDRWPHLWVPDSSLWLRRADALHVETISKLATTPMVVATSSGRASALGWTRKRPTWAAALDGVSGVTLPDPTSDTTSLLALLALRASGRDAPDDRVARVAIAAQRSGVRDVDEAFDAALTGAVTAPVVATTEQAVFARNRGSAASGLLAVTPADGVPVLDYPLAEIDPMERTVPERQGMRLVEKTLATPETARLLRRAGFRDGEGHADGTAPVKALPLPTEALLAAVTQRLDALAVPAQMLAVVDVSTSMKESAGGRSRIDVVRAAATAAVSAWRDSDQGGLWVFASDVTPGGDHRALSPLDRLSASDPAGTHRQQMLAQVDSLHRLLEPGGTPLYDTTLAAVEEVRAHYDRAAGNVVVVVTDGKNEDPTGIGLPLLQQKLRAISASGRRVRVVAVGIGPDADMHALSVIAAATPGGRAYRATDPASLEQVLFQALTSH